MADHTQLAFVVLHEDRVVLERYGRGYDRHSLLNSFSIAKAVMSTLTRLPCWRLASSAPHVCGENDDDDG